MAPVVATASFPLINLPKFYLSFTILVLLILVKYPDRVGLVNTVYWYRSRQKDTGTLYRSLGRGGALPHRVCKNRDSYDPKERYRPRARGSATAWLFDARQCEEAINRSRQDKLPESGGDT